jgi:hypothetical protein
LYITTAQPISHTFRLHLFSQENQSQDKSKRLLDRPSDGLVERMVALSGRKRDGVLYLTSPDSQVQFIRDMGC